MGNKLSQAIKKHEIPASLRKWFVIHFVVDILVGVPLLIFPEVVMPLLGWDVIDPIASRVVGAALMGIGIESWLGKDAGRDVFKAMLDLKIIWSSCAILGIGLGIWKGGPRAGWLFLGVFFMFWVVWMYYRRTLRE